MRILIIALPRTGSTSLLYKIAKEQNLNPIFEPFDGSNRFLYKNQNNIVLKTIICQHPNNLELAKKFDKIILLTRKNIEANIESHSYSMYFSKNKKYNSNNHYVYERPPENVIKLCSLNILNWNEEIKKLSTILNIPITYYEDLFDENSLERLRINTNNKKQLI